MTAVDQAETRTEGNRSHRGWWILTVLLVAAVAATWLVLGLTSQPIVDGPFTYTGTDFDFISWVDGPVDEIRYEHQKEGLVWRSITNMSRFPITLTRASWFPDWESALVHQLDVYVVQYPDNRNPMGTLLPGSPLLSTGPVAVPPGGMAGLAFLLRTDNCGTWEPGSGTGSDHLIIEFRYLGIPRLVEIPVQGLRVEVPPGCPAD